MDAAAMIDDPNIPQRAAADPTASVWVGASAGTGKTKILTDRVLNLMLAGTPPERILCLTFTKAAAAQMSTRIASQLAKWATLPQDQLARDLLQLCGHKPSPAEVDLAKRLFARVLDTAGGMNIQTIHAFCQSVLGRFPLEAGIAPHFAVVDERDAGELLRAARDAMLQGIADDATPLGRALGEIIPHVQEARFADLIGVLAKARSRLYDFFQRWSGLDGAIDEVRARLALAPNETAATIRETACADAAFAGVELRLAVAALALGKDSDRKTASGLAGWLDASAAERAATFETYSRFFLTKDDDGLPVIKTRLVTKAAAAPGIDNTLRCEAERVRAAVLKMRAAATAEATAALLRLAQSLLGEYDRQKSRRCQLDYDDLIRGAARLLSDAGAAWVLYKLDGGLDHVLIDEAQDTSFEQWQLIRGLIGEFFAGEGAREQRRTVFAVGDLKQSIFSFQGADPAAFLDNREWFGAHVQAAGEIWRPVDLRVSFRSTRAVLAAVDAVFSHEAARDGVALDAQPIVHQAYRQRAGGQVELWPALDPRPGEDLPPWTPPVHRLASDAPQLRLARIIARRIARMVKGEEALPSRGRPIRAGDIMVLVRRRTPFVDELVRALKEHHIAVAGVDRMVLAEQIAIMDLVAVGHFALLPTDDLTLASVLKGPLIGCSEEQLFALASGRGGVPLWRVLAARAADDEALAQAHRQLADILALADAVPPFEFYTEILGPFAGRRRLIGRLGRDAEDAIGEFLQLTLAYERNHLPTLQGFLHWFETGSVEIKRDLEHGAPDAVRIMTTHGAKGLEAPVVFLPDTMQMPKAQGATLLWPDDADRGEIVLWPPRREYDDPLAAAARQRRRDREHKEYRRLLYVAMTRAEDRLIVCGWRTAQREPDGCWYHLIRRGLEAAGASLGVEEVEDPFLAADPEFDGQPVALRLSYPQEEAVRPQAAPAPAPAPPLPAWARTPPPPEPETIEPLVPSRAGHGTVTLGPLSAQGAGLQRGRLIHRLLESLPQVPRPARKHAATGWLTNHAGGLPPAARDEIVTRVLALLDDPRLAELFADGSLAEVPFSGSVAGRPISGQIDRLVVTTHDVIVLDYKTDRTPPAKADGVPVAYLRQMAAYRAVLRAIYPERTVRCLLLWTETPELMSLDDPLLDPVQPLPTAPTKELGGIGGGNA